MSPIKRLAVDILLEQPLPHHQSEVASRPPPWRVGGLVDDVAQVVEAAGIGGLVCGPPGPARLAPLPRPGGGAQKFHLPPPAPTRARTKIPAGRPHPHRSAP